MSTDRDWERWGQQDPYFGVITDSRFRRARMDDAARDAFFASGESHASGVLATCRRYFGPDFAPRRILDFGCGVGRVLIPFSRVSDVAVGVDVSRSMLDEAARNCAAFEASNVALVASDDDLSQVAGTFDLVHSTITLQHVEVARGRHLFGQLLTKIAPGGAAAIQVTYAKAHHAATFGQPPMPAHAVSLQRRTTGLRRLLRRAEDDAAGPEAPPPESDPPLLMHAYPLSDLAFLIQSAGIGGFHAEFTDHGGELGVFLFFQRPASPTPCP